MERLDEIEHQHSEPADSAAVRVEMPDAYAHLANDGDQFRAGGAFP
jgi:hypothetical protein